MLSRINLSGRVKRNLDSEAVRQICYICPFCKSEYNASIKYQTKLQKWFFLNCSNQQNSVGSPLCDTTAKDTVRICLCITEKREKSFCWVTWPVNPEHSEQCALTRFLGVTEASHSFYTHFICFTVLSSLIKHLDWLDSVSISPIVF